MKLKKLIIEGFRSFGTRTEVDFSKVNAFIGNNGAGKTTCLLAMNKMFSHNPGDRVLTEQDFYVSSDTKRSKERSLMIEAIFQLDGVLEDADKGAEAEYWSKLLVTTGEKPILRIRLNAEWFAQGTTEGSVDTKYSFILSPESVDKDQEDSQPAKRSELSSIRFIYIPATRNPERQLGSTSGALISNLIRKIVWSDEAENQLIKLGKKMDDLFWDEKGAKLIQENIQQEWNSLKIGERYSKVRASLSSIDMDQLIKQVQFQFTSSVTNNDYPTRDMSDGIKSLFYISNIASLLDVEQKIDEGNKSIDIRKPLLTMFALEEPENHISPHLLGNLMNKLNEIADMNNTQVFLTSHSPAIIKRVNPENIRYVKLTNSGTQIRKIKLPTDKEEAFEFVKRGVQLYPELYFSKLVIIGEGDSEEIVLSRVFNNYSGLDQAEISVVPLGGRYVQYIWELLNSLDIRYITLLDLDMGRYQGGDGRINYVLEKLEAFDSNNNARLRAYKDQLNEVNHDREKLLALAEELEKFDIFFSSPLDLDFMMLQSFSNEYEKLLLRVPKSSQNGRLTKAEKDKILDRTLKGKRDKGYSFNYKEIMLMRYYNTLFLNRKKPVTHLEALSGIDDNLLREKLPSPLKRLVNCANKIVSSL